MNPANTAAVAVGSNEEAATLPKKRPEALVSSEPSSRYAVLGVLGILVLECLLYISVLILSVLLLLNAELIFGTDSTHALRILIPAFACTGLGIFFGVRAIQAEAPRLSPIVTYLPACLITAFGLYGFLGILTAELTPAGLPAKTEIGWMYGSAAVLGLGLGLLLGRLRHDLSEMLSPELNAKFTFIKTFVLAATFFFTLWGISNIDVPEARAWAVLQSAAMILFYASPAVFLLSWIVDIAIYTRKDHSVIADYAGFWQKLGYRFVRGVGRFFLKIWFGYKTQNARNVPESGGVILAANHGSFLDPFFSGCGTERRVHFVVYSTYYRSFAHPLFRFLRCIPMDEADQIKALRTCVRLLRLGGCVGIFPEGQVSENGKLNPPLRGGLFLAQHSGAVVVPVALKGDYEALPRGRVLPHHSQVTAIFNEPFLVGPELTKDQVERLSEQLMEDLAEELNVEPPPRMVEHPSADAGSPVLRGTHF